MGSQPTISVASSSASDRVSYRLLYVMLFLVGFALRFAFVLWAHTYVGSENTSTPFGAEICSIGRHIAEGKGFSSPFYHAETGATAWVAPVYPYLVAAAFRIFGSYTAASALVLLGFQCMMGGATGAAIHALGMRSLGERAGLWAAWIWTVSPIFFRWPATWIWDFAASALLLTVVLVVTLDTAEQGKRRQWLLLGGVWALIALTNPALISVLPVTFFYAAYVNRRAGARWLQSMAAAVALFAVLVSPWLIRNALVFGHPVFFRSNYWFEFHLSNFHFSNGMGYSGKHPNNNPAISQKYAALGEQAFIEDAKQDAFRFVRQYPREFWDLTIHRVLWFWDGTSLNYQANEWWAPWKFWPLSCAAWLGLLFVLTRRPRGWLLYAAVLLVYPLPYYFSYPHAKYRYATEPELLLLAVFWVLTILSEFISRRMRQRVR
jgi:4-amino-4-deoxy-L-arabinose transferase-like glycosyltransferase